MIARDPGQRHDRQTTQRNEDATRKAENLSAMERKEPLHEDIAGHATSGNDFVPDPACCCVEIEIRNADICSSAACNAAKQSVQRVYRIDVRAGCRFSRKLVEDIPDVGVVGQHLRQLTPNGFGELPARVPTL
jgi:hypothetical protein